MRKPAFCICENKDADQLQGNREADQRLCFSYTDSTIPLLPKSEILCVVQPGLCQTGRNPEDRFSHNEAQKGTTLIRLHMESDLSHHWLTCTIMGFVSLCRVVICCTFIHSLSHEMHQKKPFVDRGTEQPVHLFTAVFYVFSIKVGYRLLLSLFNLYILTSHRLHYHGNLKISEHGKNAAIF